MMSKLLILHDGRSLPREIAAIAAGDAWALTTATVSEAGHVVAGNMPDCVLLALGRRALPDMDEVMEALKSYDDNLPLIALVKGATLEDAVASMKAGAYDFFSWPLDGERLKRSIVHAMRLYGLTKRVFALESQVGWTALFEGMVGHSALMQEVYQSVRMVSRSNATVLILGESGTGKELVARAVHRLSPRAARRFIDINCGAIPRELLENELFGHERGAYTGADQRYIGSCERAHNGTIFLDEISEMDPALQVKMLRFLQERSFSRVGGNESIAVDVRVIAATNRNLEDAVAAGRFREDLFYRLNVVPIEVPPLKKRREDIPLLARHFMERFAAKYERMFVDITPAALEALSACDWQGNVRELENIIERIVVLYNDAAIKPEHLPAEIMKTKGGKASRHAAAVPCMSDGRSIVPLKLVEKYAIEAALAKCAGNVSDASHKLKISQATLYRKIKQYGLKV